MSVPGHGCHGHLITILPGPGEVRELMLGTEETQLDTSAGGG